MDFRAMRRLAGLVAALVFATAAHATANITLGSAAVASDGVTWTATLSGGTGTGYAISSSAGFTIIVGGLRQTITAQSISGTTLTITLGFPVGSGWTTPTFSTTTGTSISDDGGNTSQAQNGVTWTNSSTVTITVYASSNAAFGLYGIFDAAVSTGGRHLIKEGAGGSGSTGYAFAFTGTAVAIIGQPNSTGALSVSTDGSGYTTSSFAPTSTVGAGAIAAPLATGLSQAAHEIKVQSLNFYYDKGDAATAGQVQGTLLVASSAPALNVADSGAWGTEYFMDSSPFTDVVSGSNTKGIIDRAITGTTTVTSKTGYNLNSGARIRFASNSSVVAIWCYQNSQNFIIYQDGVQVGGDITAASGNTIRRMVLASGLDTGSTHEYMIVLTTLNVSGSGVYTFYVELNGNGVANVGHGHPYTDYEYGDSKVAQFQNNYITDARQGAFYYAGVYSSQYASWSTNGSGQKVVTFFRDNTGQIPATADRVICSPSVNDCNVSTNWTTFQNDYQTMLSNIRTQIGASKPILCLSPTPSTNFNNSDTYRALAATAIQNAIAAIGDANMTFVNTNGWISPLDTTTSPDGTHYNATGYAQYLNREIPIYATAAIAISGPATGSPSAPSTPFTVTLATGATFCGDQTITLSDGSNGGTFTPSVGSPGTSSVTVTPASGATSFTFTYKSAGSKSVTITPTAGQAAWTMPSGVAYSATGVVATGTTLNITTLNISP